MENALQVRHELGRQWLIKAQLVAQFLDGFLGREGAQLQAGRISRKHANQGERHDRNEQHLRKRQRQASRDVAPSLHLRSRAQCQQTTSSLSQPAGARPRLPSV